MLYKVRKYIIKLVMGIIERRAQQRINANAGLAALLREYLAQTRSTGCQYKDYDVLYRYVRRHKPREVLECGTGVSTVVIAYALMENAREGGAPGRVTSMEEWPEWYRMAEQLLPGPLKEYVDLRQSPTIEDGYLFFRGMRYRDVPERPYDLVFTDGPYTLTPSDRTKSCDFDYINILRNSDRPVAGIIDGRLTTCFVLQSILGPKKFTFDVYRNLGYVEPCTRHDLLAIDKSSPSVLLHSKRLLGRTRFYLKFPNDAADGRKGASGA